MTGNPGNTQRPFIVLAAGGTGGHVFPAEALAAELQTRGCRLALITDRRGSDYGGTLGALETHRVRAGGIAGKSAMARGRSLVDLGIGTLQAVRLLKSLRPDAVVGFGGYASIPAMAAATLLGLKTAIHEQNGVLGRANRLLAGRVRKVATSLTATRALPKAIARKVVVTGMPVRPSFSDARDVPYPTLSETGPVRLLVTGGSQGARILSDVVPAAVAALDEPLRKRLRIAQQCREEDLVRVREVYAKSGVEADLRTFFENVPERLAQAHLFIGRSGASSVAEVAAVGRPSILVPYRHAIDDHQTANAHAVDEAGAGWLMSEDVFTAGGLADRLASLLSMPVLLERAAGAAKTVGQPDAAAQLADLVQDMIAGSDRIAGPVNGAGASGATGPKPENGGPGASAQRRAAA